MFDESNGQVPADSIIEGETELKVTAADPKTPPKKSNYESMKVKETRVQVCGQTLVSFYDSYRPGRDRTKKAQIGYSEFNDRELYAITVAMLERLVSRHCINKNSTVEHVIMHALHNVDMQGSCFEF